MGVPFDEPGRDRPNRCYLNNIPIFAILEEMEIYRGHCHAQRSAFSVARFRIVLSLEADLPVQTAR